MIAIKIGDEFLDLFPDTKITLDKNNPIYAEDNIIPGDYTYPFDIPFAEASPKNTRLLDFVHVPENFNRTRQAEASLFYDNNFFRKGLLVLGIYSRGDSKLSVNLKFGLTTISDNLKEINLKTAISEQVVMASNPYTKRFRLFARTKVFSGPFTIEINGLECSGANNKAICDAINNNTSEPRAKATYFNTAPNSDSPDYFTVEPYTGADNIDSALTIRILNFLDREKWNFNLDDFETSYNNPVRAWLNANFYVPNPSDPRMRFPMLRNQGLYSDKTLKYNFSINYPYVNAVYSQNGAGFNGNGFSLNRPTSLDAAGGFSMFQPQNITSIQPFVRVQWACEKVAEILGVGLEGDFLATDFYKTALFYHTSTLETAIRFVGDKDWLYTRRSFNINEFLPDIKFVDLLKEFQKRFNLAIFFNEQTNNIRIQRRDAIVTNDTYVDFTNLSSPIVTSEEIGYSGIRLEAEVDEKENASSPDYLETGIVEQTIPTKITSLSSQASVAVPMPGSASLVRNYSLPISDREISTTIPLTFIFDSGWRLTTGSVNVNYPAASIGSMRFSGLLSLHDEWINYLNFLMRRKDVHYDLNLEFRHLLQIDPETKIMIDRVKYMYNTVQVVLTMRGIGISSCSLYKI